MPPEGKQIIHRKTNSNASASPRPADIPADVIPDILSRLPVKTLLRFRCVCNAWLKLISESRFTCQHLSRSPASLLVYAVGTRINVRDQPQSQRRPLDHVISVYVVPDPHRKTDSTLVPVSEFPCWNGSTFKFLDMMGSPNGVVCVFELHPWANNYTLWNPATRISRHVPPPRLLTHPVSSGLGFDPSSNEYKIVRILDYEHRRNVPVRAEVYSLKSGRWRPVKIGDFMILKAKCEVVLKGVPYWSALRRGRLGPRFLLVYFDVQEEVFKEGPLAWTMERRDACIGEIMGCLGAMVWDEGTEFSSDRILDVWMKGDEGGWRLIYRVRQMPVVGRILGFYGDRGVVQEVGEKGNLVMYDLEKMEVEDIINVEGAWPGTFVAIIYRETLVEFLGEKR